MSVRTPAAREDARGALMFATPSNPATIADIAIATIRVLRFFNSNHICGRKTLQLVLYIPIISAR